jgi:S1-C subfamily serine protease
LSLSVFAPASDESYHEERPNWGLVIRSVAPGSAAQVAGLRKGDCITHIAQPQIDKEPARVEDIQDFLDVMQEVFPGDRVQLDVWRNLEKRILRLFLVPEALDEDDLSVNRGSGSDHDSMSEVSSDSRGRDRRRPRRSSRSKSRLPSSRPKEDRPKISTTKLPQMIPVGMTLVPAREEAGLGVSGLRVTGVKTGLAASKATVQTHDILTHASKLGQDPVRMLESEDFVAFMETIHPGDHVNLHVWRNGNSSVLLLIPEVTADLPVPQEGAQEKDPGCRVS